MLRITVFLMTVSLCSASVNVKMNKGKYEEFSFNRR